MPRLFDPYMLHASGAVIDWARLADAQGEGGAAGVPAGMQLHLRWIVSAAAGIPPEPFSVWLRGGQDKPVPVSPFPLLLDGYQAEILPEAMLTLEVDATPDTPGQPMVLWGFGGVPSMDSVNAMQSITSSGPVTLRVRAEGIWAFVLWQGSIDAVRGASVAAALVDEWELIEVAGLPVDGAWGGTSYSPAQQGLTGSPADPATAAVGRLTRGLAPIGWAPFTQTGHPVPPWSAPDPVKYVEETQQSMLSQAVPLFAAGVAPADQVLIQPTGPTPGPATPSGTAPGESTAGVPLQGVMLVAAASDPAAALALGFGTAYPLEGKPGVAERDVMITAHYKNGHLGDGTEEEYAAIVPWPTQLRTPPGAATGTTAERAGLLTPEDPVSPWRETIRVNFDRVASSLALERPVAASFAVYPSAPGPARLLVEPDLIAGGYHTLALAPRPEPDQDQIALVDSLVTDLPLDLSARTLGHAVAVEDHFGLWSPWCDVSYTGSAPAYPIPQVVTARLDTSYAGSTTCPAIFATDVVVDWQIRQPQTLELRAVLCPLPYPGADLPPGVGPYAAAPPGCTRWDLTLSFSGDLLSAPGPSAQVEYLAADAQSTVDPAAPGFPANMHGDHGDSRRYRITVTGQMLDFTASSYYAVAVWAREQTTAAPALWGDVAATAIVASTGSPVPPPVSFVAPPVVPLGSMPDAADYSHVQIQTGGIPGALKVTVWSVSEAALRSAAGLDPQPDRHLTLPDRYLNLQQAYDSLPPSKQRAAFTRYGTFDAPIDEVDVPLPRGSAEIHLFAVTAVNAAGVESAWPGSHAGLQAAAAPQLVRPTVPELSASPHLGTGAVDLTVSARCPLAITAFELYATRVAAAATDVGSMGPPLQVIPVAGPPVDDGAPGGPLASAAFSGLTVTEDWRPLLIRAVAVPAPVDNATGTYGARSSASPVASVTVPPSTPPDLSALTVAGWGPTDNGISVQFSSSALVAATPYGPHMLAVTARDIAAAVTDPPLYASGQQPLAAIPIDTGTPPAGADAGVLVRGNRTAGRTPYGAWFVRADLNTVVGIEVVLTDPLGRVSVRNYQVPAGLLDPPTVTIVSTQAVAGLLVVQFSTDAPASDTTGPYTLDVTAAKQRIFIPPVTPAPFGPLAGGGGPIPSPDIPARPGGPGGPAGPVGRTPVPPPAAPSPIPIPFPPIPLPTVLHAQFSLPDIRAAGSGPPLPVDIDAVRDGSAAGITTYTVAARMTPPAVVTLTITTPRGLTGSARATLTGI
jgi:hypothetical protein